VGGAEGEGDTTGEEAAVLSFSEELAILRSKPEWGLLKQAIEEHLAGRGLERARQALSQHTTTACQPLKQDGPGISLKEAGLDTALKPGPWHSGVFFVIQVGFSPRLRLGGMEATRTCQGCD
jgi:hypothetical protein